MPWRWRGSIRGYGWGAFGGDAAGGLVAALIALPYGLALASLMGLPPILGVVTSIVASPICVLFGRNPVLIGGVSAVTVPFIAVAVAQQGVAGAAKVCISAAIVMMGFCVLRLGRYVSQVPQPVVVGFSCGIGGMMVISQLPAMFALRPAKGGWDPRMLVQFFQVVGKIGNAQLIPAVLALLVIGMATWVAFLTPRGPAPLCGVIVAIVVAKVFGWHEKEIGAIPLQIPAFVGFRWAPSDFWSVLPQAFGLAFVSSVNLLITSRVVTHFQGRHQHFKKHDADMELGAYGIANLLAGSFGAPTCVGIPARSIANVQCGGTTRISNLMHAGFLLGFLVLGARFIAQVPIAALAGVTAYTGARLLEWSTWRRLSHMRRVDAAAFISTALAVLVVNAVAAVAIGCSFYVLREILKRLSAAAWWRPPYLFRSSQVWSTLTPPAAVVLSGPPRRGAVAGSDPPEPVGSQDSRGK
jgi:SulP family sulfate permease